MTLEDVEVQAIEQALAHHGGNKMRTAKELGIAIRTLRTKIAFYECLAPYRADPRRMKQSREFWRFLK